MADFEVRTDSLRDATEQLNSISSQVSKISEDAKRILSNTRHSVTARLSVQLQRAVVCSMIKNCSTDCGNLAKTLFKISAFYDICEKKVESADLFDDVGSSWLEGLMYPIPNIPIIVSGFPKPVFPNAWDVIRPYKPVFINIPWMPWKPTPPFRPDFWHTPWGPQTPSGPGGQYPGGLVNPVLWHNDWRRPNRPNPNIPHHVPRPHVPTKPRYPDWIRVRPKVNYSPNRYIYNVVGPGGQNPFLYGKLTVGGLSTSLIGVKFASVGSAVRME